MLRARGSVPYDVVRGPAQPAGAAACLILFTTTDAGRSFAVHRVLGAIDVAPVVAMLSIGVAMLLLRGARRGGPSARRSLLSGAAAFLAAGAGYALGVAGLTSSVRLVGLLAGAVALAVAALGTFRSDLRGSRP